MGGEEIIGEELLLEHHGLPPRGRGRVFNKRARESANRITPAWAGKSNCLSALRCTITDYPRVGGEELIMGLASVRSNGLPPRGRGREGIKQAREFGLRITPAWAGKRI